MDINKYTLKKRWDNNRLLRMSSLMPEDIFEILHFARLLRMRLNAGERVHYLRGKTIAVLSCKPLSPCEKFSLGRAIKTLGGSPVYLPDCDADDFLPDTVSALAKIGADCVVLKGFDAASVRLAERRTTVPMLNLNSDASAPCQALADLLTLWDKLGTFSGKKLAVFGVDTPAVNSMLCAAVKVDLSVHACYPEGVKPDALIMNHIAQFGEIVFDTAENVVRGADAVYTDRGTDSGAFCENTVDAVVMSMAKPGAAFLHPLPLGRGKEVTDDIADGENSLIYREAENLFYVFAAAFGLLLGAED